MRVRELMTSDVVTVSAETSLGEVARILSEHAISGVPVVSGEGEVLGVISESDIVEKERGPDEESRRLVERVLRRRRPPAAFAKAAGDAMTSPAIVVEPWISAYGAAWLMSVHDVNRLPVVESGKLVGVIARADLVRHFARTDEEIAREIREELDVLSMADVDVVVERGAVVLQGEVDSDDVLKCLPRVISRVPGVIDVESNVTRRRGAMRTAPGHVRA